MDAIALDEYGLSGVRLRAGVQLPVLQMLARGRRDAHLGSQNIFWSVDQAMVAAARRDCACLKV